MAHIYRILQLARTKYLNQYLLADRVQNIYFRLQNFLACMHALKMNKMVGLTPREKFLDIIYIIEKRSALTPVAGWRLVVEAPGEIAPSLLQRPHPPPRILGQAVINAPPVAIWCKAVHFLPPIPGCFRRPLQCRQPPAGTPSPRPAAGRWLSP